MDFISIFVFEGTNIKKRVMQHFSKVSKKAEKLARMVSQIDYVETGSELVALLHESSEIKANKPEINKAQKNSNYPYFVHQYYDKHGYACCGILKDTVKNAKGKDIIGYYKSIPSAKSHLNSAVHNFQLCQTKVGLNTNEGSCFYMSIRKCNGACTGLEEANEYNVRAQESLHYLKKIFDENLVIIEEGRSEDESAVILIENGHYLGYGYIDKIDSKLGIEEIKEAIDIKKHNPETNGIVRNYLNGEKRKTISF